MNSMQFNSWLSDAIWHQRSWSTLIQLTKVVFDIYTFEIIASSLWDNELTRRLACWYFRYLTSRTLVYSLHNLDNPNKKFMIFKRISFPRVIDILPCKRVAISHVNELTWIYYNCHSSILRGSRFACRQHNPSAYAWVVQFNVRIK